MSNVTSPTPSAWDALAQSCHPRSLAYLYNDLSHCLDLVDRGTIIESTLEMTLQLQVNLQ